MPGTNTDLEFLRELIRQYDASPSRPPAGEEVGACLDLGADDVEATVLRLRARRLVAFWHEAGGAPRKSAMGVTNSPLVPTQAGYAASDEPDASTHAGTLRRGVAGASRDFAVDVAAAVVARHLGG